MCARADGGPHCCGSGAWESALDRLCEGAGAEGGRESKGGQPARQRRPGTHWRGGRGAQEEVSGGEARGGPGHNPVVAARAWRGLPGLHDDGVTDAPEHTARGGIVYVDHLAHCPDPALNRCTANVAVQQRLGFLSQWRPRASAPDSSHPRADRPPLTAVACELYRRRRRRLRASPLLPRAPLTRRTGLR